MMRPDGLCGASVAARCPIDVARGRRRPTYTPAVPDSVPSAPAVALRSRLPAGWASTPQLPAWSAPAALRALRTVIVMPTLFAVTFKVIGNLQMATFAAFGSFATLVLVSFAGTRRDKLIAHLGLALAGSVLLSIGTLVSTSTALAAIATVPVAFVVFFAGVAGPNAASGVTGALLAYVLPAASTGTAAMIPDRLAGWWLASLAGTAAVLVIWTPPTGDRLRAAVSVLGLKLAGTLDAMLAAEPTEDHVRACIEAKHALLGQFNATPFRPTGLAVRDQALADAVELLDWCTSLVSDTIHEGIDLVSAPEPERDLLEAAAATLRDASLLFEGRQLQPQLNRLIAAGRRSRAWVHSLVPGSSGFETQSRTAFHCHMIAIAILATGADALVAARPADLESDAGEDADTVVEAQSGWLRDPRGVGAHSGSVLRYAQVAIRHASVRSVWFVNSARGALALAAAVAVADLSSVQHGFWVVLGTLSVLRTNAASTGSTALRALLGTAAGFAVGGVLLVVIGASTTALWVTLPIAVAIASYAPGAAPFAVGQAAFTVTVAVLFNLLVPVGWKVGELRFIDVAVGCAVSVAIGSLFWPRGGASLVGDDLADSYRLGALYLREAVDWVCGSRPEPPQGGPAALTAGERLDVALRAFLAEQGTKHIGKEELWRLIGGTLRLRLTAYAVAGLPRRLRARDGSLARDHCAARRSAAELLRRARDPARASRGPALEHLSAPARDDASADGDPGAEHSRQTIWLVENLEAVTGHLEELISPAERIASIRRRPWWR